ncbi:MAG: hypothetical protein JRF37_01885 [Deltaproteobacteria bacterium]|nr:hypothetical protein [Deltaproteobacteria bacterium]
MKQTSFHPEMAFFRNLCSFLTGLLPGMPAFLAGWKEAIKESELPYREATASIGNLR